jgi:hypothetical protein
MLCPLRLDRLDRGGGHRDGFRGAFGQDIAIPLGRQRAMPLAAAHAGADRVWTMGWPFWARRRLRGFRLTASDVDWSVGEGPDVRGPIDALLLLLTGRTAAFSRLTGDGVQRLTATTGRR